MASRVATRSAKRAKTEQVDDKFIDDDEDDDDDSDDSDDDSDDDTGYDIFPRIQRCVEASPPGPFECINILDVPFSSTYKAFIERCRSKLGRPPKEPWIWIKIDAVTSHLWKDGMAAYRVKSVDDIKLLLRKLTSWSTERPGELFPEFGAVVRTRVTVTVEMIE